MSKTTKSPALLALLEGFFFIFGDEGLDYLEIKKLLQISTKKVEALVAELQLRLLNDPLRGLEIIQHGSKFKLATKAEYYREFQVIAKKPIIKLSASALETLLIIAYKNPVTKTQIEAIRGVSCDAMIHKLKAFNLIQELGRSELPGRPMLYAVTNDFFNHFNIKSLEELPPLQEYQQNLEQNEMDLYE